MQRRVFAFASIALLLSGCATVQLAPKEQTEQAKNFAPPSEGKAGIYVYRDSFWGRAVKIDIWIDEECIGRSAKDVFFYEEVEGNKKHTVKTPSEFSPNSVTLYTEAGKNYFVRQYIRMGVFSAQSDLEIIDEVKGKAIIKNLALATKSPCYWPSPNKNR